MVRLASAVLDDVLHVRTADVWMGVVSTKSPNDVKRGGFSWASGQSVVYGGASQSSDYGKSLRRDLLRHNHTEARGHFSDETE